MKTIVILCAVLALAGCMRDEKKIAEMCFWRGDAAWYQTSVSLADKTRARQATENACRLELGLQRNWPVPPGVEEVLLRGGSQ